MSLSEETLPFSLITSAFASTPAIAIEAPSVKMSEMSDSSVCESALSTEFAIVSFFSSSKSSRLTGFSSFSAFIVLKASESITSVCPGTSSEVSSSARLSFLSSSLSLPSSYPSRKARLYLTLRASSASSSRLLSFASSIRFEFSAF